MNFKILFVLVPVQDCEAMSGLFLCPFLFFFLRDTEGGIKFEYGGNGKTGNPLIATCSEHESPGQYEG